ncbi:MAG: hypothetical protein IAE90_02050 [Ignavibacteria bacterium]|nr:hypothetical protein [Ignavibacteria bacterium]
MKTLKFIRFLPIVSRETMFRLLILFLFAPFLVYFAGCDDESIPEDVSLFNKKIEYNRDIKTAKELMDLYYNRSPEEPTRNLSIVEEPLTPGRFRVTLINSKLADDSREAERLVMICKFDGTKWKVVTVERSWRCYKGRGHTDWGIEPCG